MKFVLDANIAFKWVVSEDRSDRAIEIRDRIQQGIDEAIAPDVFPLEVAHALTRAERQGRIPQGQSWPLWLSVMSSCPKLHVSISLTPRAYAISSQERIGIYDGVYVALAEKENCELRTADDRLVQRLQTKFPFVVSLTPTP